MNISKVLAGVFALTTIVFAVLYFTKPVPQPQLVAGSAGSTDHYLPEVFYNGVTVGGQVFATSSVGTVTYPASAFAGNGSNGTSIIKHTAASAVTATFPASTTLGAFVPHVGDRNVIYINAITSAVTVASSTGVIIHSVNGSAVIDPGTIARFDVVRKPNTDIYMIMTTGD